MDDVEKLDSIQDDFILYQLLRFCQSTRLPYINNHILLGHRCTFQQQHVVCKIDDTLLNTDTNETFRTERNEENIPGEVGEGGVVYYEVMSREVNRRLYMSVGVIH
jgi:hypothetical protein